ncbi:MAG: hypothetical protein R2795_05310 [Saprospiraceae bacterium]
MNMTNGTPPYQISWVGTVEGFATSNQSFFTIPNLPGGGYQVTVQDANGCTDLASITLVEGTPSLDVVHTVSNNGCGTE